MNDLIYYLTYLPYFFVPLLITIAFRYFNKYDKGATIILAVVSIISYPFIFISVRDYFNPEKAFGCGNPQLMFILFNIFIGVPVTLFFQVVFNWLLLSKKRS